MLLVHQAQHPTSPSLMPPIKLASHRRNPSAPVLSVLPTRTPGLLSLSKPLPTRQPAHNLTNVRHLTPRQHKSKSPVPKPEPQQAQAQEKQQSQQHLQRGRGTPKDKPVRNLSKSRAGHGGRARQASPTPIPPPEQAIVQTSEQDVAKQPRPSSISKSSTPVLNPPSGRLAKRRNRPPIPFPTSTTPVATPTSTPPPKAHNTKPKPVPVPQKSTRVNVLPLSRSDPTLSHFPRKGLRRAETDVNFAVFPICDDNDSDDEELPRTPTKNRGNTVPKFNATWQQQRSVFDSDDSDDVEHENGPRTAPLGSFNVNDSSRNYFTAHSTPSPLSRRKGVHKRTPSFPTDALFNSTFDSTSTSASDTEMPSVQPIDLKALFHRAMATSTPSLMSTPRPKGVIMGPFGPKYANSNFQNSPSPEQLPPPSFSFTALKSEGKLQF